MNDLWSRNSMANHQLLLTDYIYKIQSVNSYLFFFWYCSDISCLEEDMAPFVTDVSYDKELGLAVLEGEFQGYVLRARYWCVLWIINIKKWSFQFSFKTNKLLCIQ